MDPTTPKYAEGDTVTVDGVDYTVGAQVVAYTCTDADGNETVWDESEIEAGTAAPDAGGTEEPADKAPMKPGTPEFAKAKADARKAAFGG